jgi:hypothetical protein
MLTSLCRSQLNDNNNDFGFHDALTAKTDCNVAMTSQGVELHNGLKLSAEACRALAHDPLGPTGSIFARSVFEAQAMVSTVDYQILWGNPTQTVRDLLKAGWFVTLYIDYGKLTELAPSISCDKAFTGIHAVGLSDWFRGSLGASVHYHDPLADGRHPLTPKGVQTAKFSWIRDAGYAYTRKLGYLDGWAVKAK